MSINFIRLNDRATTPRQATVGSAAYDLCASEHLILKNGMRKAIGTGIAIELPCNQVYGRVASRSSLSLKGLDVGGGVIDSDYRGEISVILINNSGEDYEVLLGERIAQLILEAKYNLPFIEVDEFKTETNRGKGGFGSTGRHGYSLMEED